MILVHLLVLLYSWRACLGAHSPETVLESQDIVGHLGLLTKFSGNELESLTGEYHPSKHIVVHDDVDNEFNSASRNTQIREFSLKMLLEKLAKLRYLHKKENHIKISHTARKGENANRREHYHFRETPMPIHPSHTQHIYPSELLPRHDSDIRFTNDPVRTKTWSDFLSSSSVEGHKQSLPFAATPDVFRHLDNDLYTDLLLLGRPATAENKDIQTNKKDFYYLTVHKGKQELSVHDSKSKKLINTDGRKFSELDKSEENKISYLFTPVNYLAGKDDTEPLYSNDETLNVENSQSFDKRVDRGHERPHDDAQNGRGTDTVSSLIFKAVKKMEDIVKRQVYQYDTFLTAVQHLPDDLSETMEQANLSNENNTWLHEREYPALTGNTQANELLLPEHKLSDENGSVMEEVIKAVTVRKVPKDMRFWQRLSDYLDSSSYRSRSRRSPQGKKRKGHRYVHLSITYGHVMPCEYKDRFYCMNAGTCVFVGALDIKTCR
ncbi:hypothetical protein BsWGS_14713 [Bradybaena similaris]